MAKILLVEDNEMNSDMLSRRLQRAGFEVAIAPDGRQGVLKAISEKPDLILMDLSLPELDGWEATALLKRRQVTSHIPVIALTAHCMRHEIERAAAAGCDEYETKPVVLDRLLQKINVLLKEAQSQAEKHSSPSPEAG